MPEPEPVKIPDSPKLELETVIAHATRSSAGSRT
jgi:hypothetical protein